MSETAEESAEAFSERCSKILFSGFATLAIAVGSRLRLFEHLPTTGDKAVTAQQLADALNYKERYVREWLSAMVCADIVKMAQPEQRFWLPGHRSTILTKFNPSGTATAIAQNMTMLAAAFDRICDCFRLEGPTGVPYEEYRHFTEYMAGISDKVHENSLLDKFIPSIPGLIPALDGGIEVLDVGCGTGTPSFMLAQRYPHSTFYGIDFLDTAIDAAEKRSSKYRLPNLHYEKCSATQMPAEWNDRFSYVTTFDSIHDQARPDLALKEIYRVLKPGGRFSMVDIKAHSDLIQNKDSPSAAMMYTISLFHCMPVSLYFKDGLGLGTMWGKQKALEMLKESGFLDVQVFELPYNEKCLHYLCRKENTL